MVNDKELIAGRYRIEGPPLKGGMGVVYRAHDTRLNCAVALKMVPPEVAQNPELRHALEQEARALRAIGSHPGIATVYDLEPGDGEVFMVQEFVEGVSLRDRLSQE